MNPKDFGKIMEEFTQKEESIMIWKAKEYSDETDRLQNFKEIADFFGNRPVVITPEIVALLYMLKHVQSVKRAVLSGDAKLVWDTEDGEGFKQRLADIRNYILLLYACVEYSQKEKEETS